MRDKIKKHNQLDWRDVRNPNHVVSHRETDKGTVVVSLVSAQDSEGAKARSALFEMCGMPDFRINTQFESVSALQVKQFGKFETPEISDALYGQAISVKALPRNACVGDMIGNKAKHLGVVGYVIDGLVWNLSRLREIDLPVYATDITAFVPLHRGAGELCH